MAKRKECRLCPLWEGATTVCVPPDLPDGEVDVLCVGEAPGQHEDQDGVPFSGDAGKLLRATLGEVLPADAKVGYTNVCRCRPPMNRTPSLKERRICSEAYLHPEIKKVNPKVIIALGASALRVLTGMGGVLKRAGRVYDGIILAGAHPAYVLRTPGYLGSWKRSLAVAREMLTGPDDRLPTDYRLLAEPEEIREVLGSFKEGPVAFDYETTGLDPFKCEVTSVSVCGEEGTAYSFEPPEDVWTDWLRSSCQKVVHNLQFEGYWSLVHYGQYPENVVWDTQLAAKMMDENSPSGLKDLALHHTDMGVYDAEVQQKVEKVGWENLTIGDVWRYNCADSDATYRISFVQQNTGATWTRSPEHSTSSGAGYLPALPTLMESSLRQLRAIVLMRHRGISVKRSRLPWTLVAVLKELHSVRSTMRTLSLVETYEKMTGREFNPNSPDQKRVILYELLSLPASKHHRTDAGLSSTGLEFLESVKGIHPIVELLIEYQHLNQIKKNFLLPMVEMVR